MRGLARYGLVLIAVFFLAGLGRAPADADSPGEFDAWNAILRAPTDAGIATFLTKYPESPFRQKAADMLADLRGTSPADVLDEFGASKLPQSAPAVPAPANKVEPPKPEPPKPVGTFEQSGRKDDDEGSGWYSWEDTLVLHPDGTAELTVKYKKYVYLRWLLSGCESGKRMGTYLWKRKYTVTVAETTVSLQPQGPGEVSRVDPMCWDHGAGTGGDKPWVLDWIDGRLSNADGEYVRRNY